MVTIETALDPLNADTSAEFRCRVTGSRPAPSLHWELSGWNASRLDSFAFVEGSDSGGGDGNSTSSVLVLPLRAEDNFKNLTCIAENPLIENRTWSHVLELSIHREYCSFILKHCQCATY